LVAWTESGSEPGPVSPLDTHRRGLYLAAALRTVFKINRWQGAMPGMGTMKTNTIRRIGMVGMALLVGAPGQVVAQDRNPEADRKPPQEVMALEELVVTATGFEQRRIIAPASVTVLSRSLVQQQRNMSLAEMLTSVEGIDVGDQVGKTGGLRISLRGMPSEYTLILIDGRRQNAAGNVTPNGFGETSTGFLPPLSSIERIEVIRGPMATLYGSDAMGGVINVITRPVGTRWHGSLSTDATVQENA